MNRLTIASISHALKKTFSIFSMLVLVSSGVFIRRIDGQKKSSDMEVMKKVKSQVKIFYKNKKE